MSIDPTSFRRALGQFATGVTVVTTRDAAGHPLGLTVSAFCSVSLHPPLVLVCVDHRSEANAGMRESGLFAVNVLGEEQEAVSRRFAAPAARSSRASRSPKGSWAFPSCRGRSPTWSAACARSTTRATTRSGWARCARSPRTRGGPFCITRAPTGRSTRALGVASPAAIEYKD
jgi:hypothetical protein